MVHASTPAATRKEDLRDFIIKLKKKETHIREERQRLEAELQTILNREFIRMEMKQFISEINNTLNTKDIDKDG